MNPMREHLEDLLRSTGAFLRCDRLGALYVTDLSLRCTDGHEITQKISAADFQVEKRGMLLTLVPGGTWIVRFEKWAAGLCDESELTRLFMQRTSMNVCSEEMNTWFEGIKRLELNQGLENYEKTVRQTAAVALRKQCGGALHVCGLCLDLLKEGIIC